MRRPISFMPSARSLILLSIKMTRRMLSAGCRSRSFAAPRRLSIDFGEIPAHPLQLRQRRVELGFGLIDDGRQLGGEKTQGLLVALGVVGLDRPTRKLARRD